MSKDLKNNLAKLREIKMTSEQITNQKDFLMSQIQSHKVSNSSWSTLVSFISHPYMMKSFSYVAAVFVLLIAGSAYTMSAASKSIPGNIFYPVKISFERMQVSLAADEATKTKKQIEFADRRLAELVDINDNLSPVEKQEKVAQVVKYFNSSLKEVKTSLAKDGDTALDVAKLVNEKTQDFENVLVGHYEDMPITVRSVIEKEVSAIKYQSLEVMVAKYNQHDQDISKEMLVEQLEERIISFGEYISQLEEGVQAEALEKLSAMQELLDADEFVAVVEFINNFAVYLEEINNPVLEEGQVLGISEISDELEIDISSSTETSTSVVEE